MQRDGAQSSKREGLRWLWRFVLVVFMVPFMLVVVIGPFLYLLMAVLLGCIASPNAPPPPLPDGEEAIPVYVVSNGSHTDFVLPTANAVFDWRVAFPGIGATDHIQIGWGSRTFYAEVPEWKDLTPHVALRALAADRSVILVTPSDEPQAWDPQVRRIRLSPERYRSLVLDIYSRLESTRPLDNAPFFYPGRERFTPFLTCNEWIRRRLAAIHVKTPLWSPFDRAILWHLESEL